MSKPVAVQVFENNPNPYRVNASQPTQPQLQKRILDGRLFIQAPPETLWQFITQPEALSLWNEEIAEVCVSQWFSDEEVDFVGTLRTLFLLDSDAPQTQMITDWEPNYTLGYTTLDGFQYNGHEINLHVGLFRLYECADGTEVQWLNYVEFVDKINHPAWLNCLAKQYRRNLVYLKWQAEHATHA